jgi:mRNA interferase MazF
MKRGEIYIVDLSPTIGSEISKTRPVLIISNDINNKYASCVTILPITSKVDKIYPFEVLISENESGLRHKSKVKANQIRTIDKSRLIKKISELNINKMDEINSAVKIHLDMI